jgi:hypothetical protein
VFSSGNLLFGNFQHCPCDEFFLSRPDSLDKMQCQFSRRFDNFRFAKATEAASVDVIDLIFRSEGTKAGNREHDGVPARWRTVRLCYGWRWGAIDTGARDEGNRTIMRTLGTWLAMGIYLMIAVVMNAIEPVRREKEAQAAQAAAKIEQRASARL